MNAANAVQLLIVVWSFAVCQVDADGFSVNCGDVNGTVGNEVTFTCSVTEKDSKCCLKKYFFKYTINNEIKICEKDIRGCEQRGSFTCRYTPTSAMKENFRFFIQTYCSQKTVDFTVDISENAKAFTDAPGDHQAVGGTIPSTEEHQDRGFKFALISAVVSCVIIITMAIAYKIRKRRCLGPDHENESSI